MADYQPTATGPSSPPGHAWDASSVQLYNRGAWKAADDSPTTWWASKYGPPEWWRYIPPEGVIFNGCSLACLASGEPYMLKDFQVQGWDGSWKDLLVVTGETGWSGGEVRYYNFDNTTAYTQYRFYITANNGGSIVMVAEVEWFEAELVTRVTDQLLEQMTCRYAHSVAGGGSGRVPDQLLGKETCKY